MRRFNFQSLIYDVSTLEMILKIIYKYGFEFGSKYKDLTFVMNEELMCEGSTIYISRRSQVGVEKNPFGHKVQRVLLFFAVNVYGHVCNHVLKMFIHIN